MWKHIKDRKTENGYDFCDIIISGLMESETNIKDKQSGKAEIELITKKIPKFQIAIPVNYTEWNYENYIPLVAIRPVGKRDKDISKVKAYASNGYVELDSKIKPKEPVIVIGINERTDFEGNVRDCYLNKNSAENQNNQLLFKKIKNLDGNENILLGGGGDPPVYCANVTLNIMDVSGVGLYRWGGDWTDGNPEFYFDTYYNNTYLRTYFDIRLEPFPNYYVENEFNVSIIIAPYVYGSITYIHMAEEDGGLLGSDDPIADFYIPDIIDYTSWYEDSDVIIKISIFGQLIQW